MPLNGTDSRRQRAIVDCYASENGLHLTLGGYLPPEPGAPRAFNTQPIAERIAQAAEALALGPRARAADSKPEVYPPDNDEQRDFFTDKTPSGERADYSDGTMVQPPSPRPRRFTADALRKIHGRRTYTTDEKAKLHTWLDKVIDRRLGRKPQSPRAADSWTEDLHRDAAATERFGTDMLADDDLARRYIEGNQRRWPDQTNFTAGQPKAFTAAQAERLQARWTAKAADKRNDTRSDAQRFEDDARRHME
jgi:hypothetical protein